MIGLTTNRSPLAHDLEDMLRLFYPAEEREGSLLHDFLEEDGQWVQRFTLDAPQGRFVREDRRAAEDAEDPILTLRLQRRAAKLALYRLLREATGMAPPWGSLTGIRPTKLYRQLAQELGSDAQAQRALVEVFDISPAKAELLSDVIASQAPYYRWGEKDAVDVYLGIPFCRTRCLYCSFVSTDLSHASMRALLDPYVEAVLRDIAVTAALIRDLGKRVRTLYVGGGTPSSIGTQRLGRVLDALAHAFPEAEEWTVEAGRPDTMGDGMLPMLRNAGVGRISVNPQTMQADTLRLIGRDHTPAQVIQVLDEAQRLGFSSVNADLIMGLPGEGLSQVEDTLRQVREMPIDNLTVHTLAVKRSSKLHEFPERYVLPGDEETAAMVELGAACAREMGMRPYYMYRQKHMTGNLENVGYAAPGRVCVYNIDMMEETHSIVAMGAGAISKRMYYAENRHERFPHPKNPAYYLENLDRLLGEKRRFFTED